MNKTINMDRVLIEIKEILNYVGKDMYNKVPDYIKNIVNCYSSNTYEFKYDINKELEEQNICIDTKNFIAYLYYNYWADDESKKRIEEAWDRNENKYNSSNIFNNKIERNIVKESKEQTNTELVIKNEKWYKKILNKIKALICFNKKG